MYSYTLPKIFRPFSCKKLIRLGKDNDGGYLVNLEDVFATNTLISLGVGSDLSFEKQFCQINDCKVIAIDKDNVEDKFFSDNKFFVQKNINSDNLENYLKEKNIFLKCDIEGTEYNLLELFIKYSYNFTGIVIELHDINKDKINSIYEFISKVDQKIVHIHVNNYFYYKVDSICIPDILEVTLSSSKNLELKELVLPNKLDMPNNPNDNDFGLKFN